MEKIRFKSVVNNNKNVLLPITENNGIVREVLKDEDGKITEENLVLTLDKDIPLNEGELIFFQRHLIDERMGINKIIFQSLRIKKKDISDNNVKLAFDFPFRKSMLLKKVTFPVEGKYDSDNSDIFQSDSCFKLEFSNPLDLLQEDIDNKENDLSLISEPFYTEIEGEKRQIEIDKTGFSIYSNPNREVFPRTYNDFLDDNELYCNIAHFDTDLVSGMSAKFSGSPFFYEKKLNDDNSDIKAIYQPANLTQIFYTNDFYSIPVMITSDRMNDLNNEENLHKEFIENLIQDVIPDYIDMEKQSFEPYYKDGEAYKKINEIRIKPFFRKRILNGWNTADNLYWGQSNDKGDFENIENGDSLESMNFHIDDVKYKKKKISQSFFRLSFYDKPDPLKQMLLYYSTVFLDVNEFYSTMVQNREILFDDTLGNEKTLLDEYEKRLRCNVSIKNRNNTDKSSEGFYAYFFPDYYKTLNPDYTEGDTSKYIERDIYMKIEFNHAGVGKTIPLMVPFVKEQDEEYNPTTPPKDFVLENTETKEKNIDMQKYFSYLYIPLKAFYYEKIGKFIYLFPKKMVDEDGVVTLNIFEPKING